jgi:hypothetical protein
LQLGFLSPALPLTQRQGGSGRGTTTPLPFTWPIALT